MNSYTIKIAGYDLRLRCDLTPESLDEIVKKVDGYITGLCARSSNISKTEAAILCALEFCSACEQVEQSKGQNDDEREKLIAENQKATAQIARLEAKLEAQKGKYEAAAATQKERADAAVQTQKEKYEGRIENMKEKYETRIAQLKAKLDELRTGSAQQMSMDIPAEEADEAAKSETVESAVAPAVETVPETAEPATTEADAAETANAEAVETPAKKSKSKVGSMFELLTYGDV